MQNSKAIETRVDLLNLMNLLAVRLERLSADSIYAHRASGYRGNLLREIDRLEMVDNPWEPKELARLQVLIDACYSILVQAALEIH